MTLVDWHPEELLDKHYAGALGHDERDALERHAATCSACRLELMLEDDFEAELASAGPLPGISAPASGPTGRRGEREAGCATPSGSRRRCSSTLVGVGDRRGT